MDAKSFWLGVALGGGSLAGVAVSAAPGDLRTKHRVENVQVDEGCVAKINAVVGCFWDGDAGSVTWHQCYLASDGRQLCSAEGDKTVPPDEAVGKTVIAVEK